MTKLYGLRKDFYCIPHNELLLKLHKNSLARQDSHTCLHVWSSGGVLKYMNLGSQFPLVSKKCFLYIYINLITVPRFNAPLI